MTLKDIKLQPRYISLEDDVAKLFYIPVMSNCNRFDRISCYFSFDAIAKYSTGIYYLGKNGGTFRLIISENISEETFNIIKDGFIGYHYLDDNVRKMMRQELSLDDTVTLSNLAYLIKCGLVKIKFAFCRNGLFHEKSGYAEDNDGNSLSFNGSNNETKEAFDKNYEKFEVTASWLSSDFDSKKIIDAKNHFDTIWNGENPYVKVMDPPESFDKYLQCFNRGTLFKDEEEYLEDSYYLDVSDGKIHITLPESINNPSGYKFDLRIQSLVEEIRGHTLILKSDLSKRTINSVLDKLQRRSEKDNYKVSKSDEFVKYVSKPTDMEEMAYLGISIKQKDPSHNEYFNIFKREVCTLTENDLRDEQLWDSYFAFRMRKSANFSVPGSGKTATALGMFAYLNRTEGVNKLIVIGPLNSFDSWKYEFKRVFGDNLPLNCVTSYELREMGNQPIQYHVRFSLGKYNLILLNYESFDHNPELTDALQDRIDEKTMLVFDEVHRIKAVNGKRANGVMPVAKNSRYTIVMTGTPIPNSYSDVYNFLHILYDAEYEDYFIYNSQALSDLKGDEMENFNKKLQPFYCRTTKNKLNVPLANRDCIIRVPASEEENDLFHKLYQLRMNPLSLMIRILQLESNPYMLNEILLDPDELSSFFIDTDNHKPNNLQPIDGAVEILTEKTKKCVELVKKLTQSNKTVIIWCIFINSIKNIAKLLENEGISVCTVYGETKDRQNGIERFKNGNFQVLITNPQTLAESVSLHHVCHDAIYFEYSYNLIHLLQSKDRIHRLGLPRDQYTQYYFLETIFNKDTQMISLDEQIYDRLDQKEKVMLNAIENDCLEHFFSNDVDEIEEILLSIGFDKENMK